MLTFIIRARGQYSKLLNPKVVGVQKTKEKMKYVSGFEMWPCSSSEVGCGYYSQKHSPV